MAKIGQNILREMREDEDGVKVPTIGEILEQMVEMDREYNIEMNKERKRKEYWVDRSGKIHRFRGDLSGEYASFHSEIARQLYPESNRPTDILMDLGWVMVGSRVYSHPIIHKKPSQAQINKLDGVGLYKYLTFQHNGYYINYDENQSLCF